MKSFTNGKTFSVGIDQLIMIWVEVVDIFPPIKATFEVIKHFLMNLCKLCQNWEKRSHYLFQKSCLPYMKFEVG